MINNSTFRVNFIKTARRENDYFEVSLSAAFPQRDILLKRNRKNGSPQSKIIWYPFQSIYNTVIAIRKGPIVMASLRLLSHTVLVFFIMKL